MKNTGKIIIPYDYKNAYRELGMDPKTTSLKEINEYVYNMDTLHSTSMKDVQRAFDAADYLKKNSPKKHNISKDTVFSSFSFPTTWNENYEKFHIYFEQRFKNANRDLIISKIVKYASGVSAMASFCYAENKPNDANGIIFITSISIFVISSFIAKHKKSIKNDKLSHLFMAHRKQYDSIKQKTK